MGRTKVFWEKKTCNSENEYLKSGKMWKNDKMEIPEILTRYSQLVHQAGKQNLILNDWCITA